jgi:8-oxo-dGTP diphosphatase
MDELLGDAAKRELHEETGLTGIVLYQLGAFDKIDRDPRDRNIAFAFWGFTTSENSNIAAGDDAEKAEWFAIETLPPLAFDHEEIIRVAKEKLGL